LGFRVSRMSLTARAGTPARPPARYRRYFKNVVLRREPGLSLPEHRVVAGGAHEEEHDDAQVRVGTRGQEAHPGHALGLLGDGRAVGGVVLGPGDELLLDAPDHPPDVEHHDPANASADADRNQAIPLPEIG